MVFGVGCPRLLPQEGTLGSDRVMLALYDFCYPSKKDLLGEAMAGWMLVATFLLLMALA